MTPEETFEAITAYFQAVPDVSRAKMFGAPTLKTGIALALLEAGVADDDVVMVDIRSRQEPFMITKPPFVTPGVREA